MTEPYLLATGAPAMEDEVRVVVVDDMRDAAETLSSLLEINGYRVRMAHDGDQALALIDEYRPHCVLMDINMPGMDGCELSRRLRERYVDDIVLIAVTGGSEDEKRVAETFARVDHYLRKPDYIAQLAKVLPPLQEEKKRIQLGNEPKPDPYD